MMIEPGILPEHSVWLPVLIFFARVVDVSIGTVRLICVTRGRRALAVILGFFEVMIWILAISSVFAHLDRWVNILAFAGGFAAGNAVGMWIEKALAMGTQIVRLISRGNAHAVAERLRFEDLAVTTLSGNGRDGLVSVCMAIVPRKITAAVVGMARQIDPDVLVTVEDAVESTVGRASTQYPGKMPFRIMPGLGYLGLGAMLRQRHRGTGESSPLVPAA